MMKEYRGYNLASTYICPGLRVSTGIVVSGHLGGLYEQLETCVFTDVKWVPRWKQIIHGTAPPHFTSESAKAKALRAHAHIARNLRREAVRRWLIGMGKFNQNQQLDY